MTQREAGRTTRPIPTFASRAEEAEFWDSHDLTDYFDDFEYKPAWFRAEGPLSESVTLHIDIETMEEVRALAEEQGYPPDVLLQIWILERRDAERQRRAAEAEQPDRAANAAPAVDGGTAPA